MVSKRDYRCRAHTNPFKDTMLDIPATYENIDWSLHFVDGLPPVYIDIGCGYGKFLIETAKQFPESNVLGLEIRDKVAEFVHESVKSIENCSVIKANAMLFLPNFFKPGSLKKLFVLFPDPHFKKKKQKARIICRQTMQLFKYLLDEDGELYISTDVKSLFEDMCLTIESSNCFVQLEMLNESTLFNRCYKETDEAARAGVKSGQTFGRVYKVLK
ncbi:tRNA (guanine-N(7)-)-methyltransferase (tRNA(m7G46)-methyltransferase) [Glugoides intestinalis]